MDTNTVILFVVVLFAAAIAAFFLWQKNRSTRLKKQFGEEYDHTVKAIGDKSRAEKELEEREKRVAELKLHPLSQDQRRLFEQKWVSVQAFFVDEPSRAVQEADLLIKEVMHARGYPVGDFERRASDISVNYPRVVRNYRAADAIALRNVKGQANTDDLRQAILYYRELFEDLMEKPTVEVKEYREVVHK